MAGGLAAGAAVTGQLIDLAGARGGFFGVVGAGLLLIVASADRAGPGPVRQPGAAAR